MFRNLSTYFPKGIRSLGSREELQDENLQRLAAQECEIFSKETLVAACDNFHPRNQRHESFRFIYKDGREVAVERLSRTWKYGREEIEFMKETELLSRLQHPNVERLIGYCAHNNEFSLVYEYVPNSLHQLLFSQYTYEHHRRDIKICPNGRQQLNWTQRYEIFKGTVNGLNYLHSGSQNGIIIHGDINPTNILLDHELKPIISGIETSHRLIEFSTYAVRPFWGYIAPEYLMCGQISVKTDVYGFGVLLLELISGQNGDSFASPENNFGFYPLINRAYKLYKENRSLELLDPTLADSFVAEQVTNYIKIGLLCVQAARDSCPSMDHVVSVLTGNQGLMGIQTDRENFFGTRSFEQRSLTSTSSFSFDEDALEEALEELRFRTEIFNNVAMNNTSNSSQIMEEDSYSNSFIVPAQDGHEGQKDEILRKKIDAQNCQRFSYETLHDATDGFASQNVLGQGGFGLVYKGKLDDGRDIAVKKSSNMSERQGEALITEVELLSSLKHPNVVKLFGYCADNNEFLLVYEYVPNKSLDKLLFGESRILIGVRPMA